MRALDAPVAPQRLGVLAGEIVVPDHFDRMGEREIEAMFGAGVARYSAPVRKI